MKIEKLIQCGYLKEFTGGRTYEERPQGRGLRKRENLTGVGRIATISGGIYGGGDFRNTRKKYAQREVYIVANTHCNPQAITFTDEDCQGLEMPHDDPLVIAPKIGHFTVERMLVDMGSSTDILYLSTFDKLYVPRSMIQPVRTPNRVYKSLLLESNSYWFHL
ncbi:hypothetical protein LIER_02254 [Lithospermum erythrorhizon]|uniref:Uncharacterized protein n=1 Tax=Lithospermum erythrorhizon TaxID=34254 RepID=A0AAV3NTH4_LITER